MSFFVRIPAKCTLSGEHVIVHQGFALVAPFNRYSLSLKYTKNNVNTSHTISAEGYNSLQILLWPVLNKALEMVGENPRQLRGEFDLKSSIPIGAGLGFSAALCAAVALWAVDYGLITKDEFFDFSIQLEDLFHVKSSGVDIAGVMAKGLIQYFSDHHLAKISPKWRPNLYLSSSGERSITENCAKKVNRLHELDLKKATKIDNEMINATIQMKKALEIDRTEGIPLFKEALNKANACFYEWDLVSEKLDAHIKELQKYALACKVIGAGYGGFVLSFWEESPNADLPFKLYSLFPEH